MKLKKVYSFEVVYLDKDISLKSFYELESDNQQKAIKEVLSQTDLKYKQIKSLSLVQVKLT